MRPSGGLRCHIWQAPSGASFHEALHDSQSGIAPRASGEALVRLIRRVADAATAEWSALHRKPGLAAA